jgi:hypothetical protein
MTNLTVYMNTAGFPQLQKTAAATAQPSSGSIAGEGDEGVNRNNQ